MPINPGPPPPVAHQAEFDRWVRLLAAALGASNSNSSIIADAVNTGVAAHEGKADPHPQYEYSPGFENRTESALSFNDGTRTLTVAPTGASFAFSSARKDFTKTGAQTVVITDTEGLWFCYFDGTGTLTATQTFSEALILTYALAAIVYWDADNNAALLFMDERHGRTMDGATHLYAHNTRGTVLDVDGGLTLGDILADELGNSATHAQFSVAAGAIWDEDIKHSIASMAAPANIPILYRSGAAGAWRRKAADAYPLVTTGTGRAAWNQLTGGVWQLAEVANLDFVLMHYFAIGANAAPKIVGIVGQADYATIADAQAGAESELRALVLAGLPVPEMMAIGTVIFQTANTYTNAVKSRIRSTDAGADYIDWRTQVIAAPGGGSALWGSIGGTLSAQTDLQAALDAAAEIYTLPAGATLSGHRMVYKDANGKAQYASNTSQSQTLSILGMTTGAAVLDDPVQVIRAGEITEPSWTWTLGQPVFLSTDGLLTQTVPTTGFLRIIGFPTAATSLLISLHEPIALA